MSTLTTAIALLSLFAMDWVKRNILSVWLLITCQPVLLEPLNVLSGAIWCDRMRNERWGESDTASLNIILLWSVDFVLVNLALLT